MANYLALTKPRIIELLLVTTVPVMFLAEGGVPSLWLVLATLVGGTLSAGAANTFNSVYDRDIDRLMHRTSNRPMVTGEITPRNALVFGAVAHGRVDRLVRARRQRAVRGAVGRGDRALRRRLHDAAQAPHVAEHRLGRRRRAACRRSSAGRPSPARVQWPAVILFLVIFFWTPPHYWPLSMAFRDDYSAAGVPMLPVEQGPVAVGRQIVLYSWVMVATSLVLVPVALDGLGLRRHGGARRRAVPRRGAPPAPRRQGRRHRPGAEADAPVPLLDHLRDGGVPRGGRRPAAPRRHRLSRQVAQAPERSDERGERREQVDAGHHGDRLPHAEVNPEPAGRQAGDRHGAEVDQRGARRWCEPGGAAACSASGTSPG